MTETKDKEKQRLLEQLKALDSSRKDSPQELTDEQAKLLARAIKRVLKKQLH